MQTRNSMQSLDVKEAHPETSTASAGSTGNGADGARGKSSDRASAEVLYLRESDFLKEETFREVLFYERKRAERARKKLSLLLLDVSGISDAAVKYAMLRQLAKTLAVLNPEITLNGWYKDEAVLGAILREQAETKKEALRERIQSALTPLIDRTQCLKLAVCSFPGETHGDAGPEAGACFFYPDRAKEEKGRRLSLFVKRAMDIAGGIFGVLLFSPLFIALPLLIKATSKGPVLFRQERIGRYGGKFIFLKFRTMFVDNDSKIHQEYIKNFIREKKSYDTGRDNGQVYKIKDDPRVTLIGRFLRKTSLDELPQFFNVLTGEMSLVGPRPPIPYELENYDFWHLRRVMEIKPGITGLWQVEGRSSTTFDEMVRLDLKYAREWSVWLDIKILLKTPWVVLAGKGAY